MKGTKNYEPLLFNNVPAEYLDKFCAVRDAFSNLENLLVTAEILNTCHESWNKETKDFDLLISTGTHKRILVKKQMVFYYELTFSGNRV